MQTFASTANRSNTTSTSELTIDGLILSRQQQHLLSLPLWGRLAAESQRY